MMQLLTSRRTQLATLAISVCLNIALILRAYTGNGPPSATLPQLTTAHVLAAGWSGDHTAPNGLGEFRLPAGDFLVAISNQYPDGRQDDVHHFLNRATNLFVLKSSGHPDIRAKLTGAIINAEHIKLESFEAKVDDADRPKLAHGTTYRLESEGDEEKTVHWSIPPALTLRVP